MLLSAFAVGDGAQFACFTGTKVQILTLPALSDARVRQAGNRGESKASTATPEGTRPARPKVPSVLSIYIYIYIYIYVHVCVCVGACVCVRVRVCVCV
jgi:hypothetical protein